MTLTRNLAAAALVAAAVSTTGCSIQRAENRPTDASASLAAIESKGMVPMTDAQALLALNALPVKASTGKAAYSRALFPHWRSASANGWGSAPKGCNAKYAGIIRDGVGVRVGPRCRILSGSWTNPYDGQKFTAVSALDADHVVPLANIYGTGAKAWPLKVRAAYANDPLVVMTVWDCDNRSKGDKGPEAWRPASKGVWNAYAKRWIAVKAKYAKNGVWVTPAEKAALVTMLNTRG